MCGRTAITKSAGEIADACSYRGRNNEVQKPTWKGNGSKTYNGSYNKGPKSCSPILLQNRLQHSGTNEELSERIIMPMQWGMVPSWHKGDPKKFNFNMINCRCDTITEKKSFAKALENGQRCVVLAEGFYEWHAENGNKQPYYIQLKDSITPHLQFNKEIENEEDGSCQTKKSGKQLLTMAGLFDKHVSEEQGELYTYTIITVDSSSSMKWLHHRMPAILETPESVERWLDAANVSDEKALELLKPTNCLEWYPVSEVVNNVRNDTSDCIKKIDLAKIKARKAKSGMLMANWLKKGEKRKSVDESESAHKKTK